MKQLYKVLKGDLVSPFQNFQYELGKKYHCDNFDATFSNPCSNGFYATDLDGLPYTFRYNKNQLIILCNVWGKEVEIDLYKRRYGNIELIEVLPFSQIKEKTENSTWWEFISLLYLMSREILCFLFLLNGILPR